MTRVIVVKLFRSQAVIRVREEPVVICRGPRGAIVLATRSGFIELHTTRDEDESDLANSNSNSNPNLNTSSSSATSSGGGGSSRSVLQLRFRAVSSGVQSLALLGDSVLVALERDERQALCVRLYSCDDGRLICQTVLPSITDNVVSLAVCPSSSRFVVTTLHALNVMQYADGKLTSLLEVAVSGVSCVAFYGGSLLAWCCGTAVRVLQLDLIEQQQQASSSMSSQSRNSGRGRRNSSAADDDAQSPSASSFSSSSNVPSAHRVPNLDACVDIVKDSMVDQIALPTIHGTRQQQAFVALGPFDNFGICVNVEEGWILRSCKLVVAMNVSRTSRVHSLRFAPERAVRSTAGIPPSEVPSLCRLLVSTEEGATLFSVSGKPSVLAEYTYSSSTIMASIDECFLYALHAQEKNGTSVVEVFSLRPSSAALPLRDADLADWAVVNTSRDASLDIPPPCMLASLPFVGLHSLVTLDGGYVGLLSKLVSDTDAHWSVSVLVPERASEIWRELASKAALVKQENPDAYLQIHLEACLLLAARQDDKQLFLDSCRIIGNFCEAQKWFLAAALFFGLAKVPIDEVTRRLLHERGAALALVEFVNRALLENDERLSLVGVGVGNSLIEHLAKHRPAELPNAVLTCRMAFDPTLAVRLLVRAGTQEEAFARAYCTALCGDDATCATILKSLDTSRLVQCLQQYESCWRNKSATFSSLLLKHCGFSLLEAVWGLRVPPADSAQLLGGDANSFQLAYLEHIVTTAYSASPASSTPPSSPSLDFACVLQLFQGYLESNVNSLPAAWQAIMDKFKSMRLVDLADTSVDIRWVMRHGQAYRAYRPLWFPSGDALPVYVGKLVALYLFLKHNAPASMVVEVAKFLETTAKEPHHRACRLVWLPALGQLNEAVQLALEKLNDEEFLGFWEEFGTDADDWRIVLAMVAAESKRSALFKLLLSRAAEDFPFDKFLELLPSKGSVAYFLPYAFHSYQRHSPILQNIAEFSSK